MPTERWIIVDREDYQESHYVCDCGFDKYLGETCSCDDCQYYKNHCGLPLTSCPDCKKLFMVYDD